MYALAGNVAPREERTFLWCLHLAFLLENNFSWHVSAKEHSPIRLKPECWEESPVTLLSRTHPKGTTMSYVGS